MVQMTEMSQRKKKFQPAADPHVRLTSRVE